jgi:MoxR-like ATPase
MPSAVASRAVVNLQRLRDGVVEVETAGMLPEAEVAFLDKVFLGSTAVLNTLLGILNERIFRRGATSLACPLRVCVGATSSLPDDPALAAFADRFLTRVFVSPVADARLEELLEAGWALGNQVPPAGDGTLIATLDRLAAGARGCDLVGVQPLIGTAVRRAHTTWRCHCSVCCRCLLPKHAASISTTLPRMT